jgi:hypothetical protein
VLADECELRSGGLMPRERALLISPDHRRRLQSGDLDAIEEFLRRA